MLLRFDDVGPADTFGETKFFILQDRHTSGSDHFQRSQMERVQRRLDDVQSGKIFRQLPSADRFQITKIRQIPEFGMRRLDVDESRDFFQCGKDFQPVGIHARIARSEGEIRINLLESGERVIQNRDGSVDDRTVPEAFDVAGVNDIDTCAHFRAGSVADDTFTVDGLLLGRANANASSVVLEQMFGTRFNAGGAVSVFAFRVRLPRVGDWIVTLHGRTFLLANAIVEKIPASLFKKSNPSLFRYFFF